MSGRDAQSQMIDDAIDLVIRLQLDARDAATLDQIEAFRTRSEAHEAIWTRVSSLHGAAGAALTKGTDGRISRGEVVAGGLVALFGGAVAYATVPGLLSRAGADHATARGEVASYPLPDGSTVTLGPDSAISLSFTATERRVRLMGGVGFFDVAADAARPFTVSAGGVETTALGTAFDVSDEAGRVAVSVAHGSVSVRGDGGETTLAPLDWISFDGQRAQRGTRAADEIAVWRDKVIIADNEPLAALVSRINRWMATSVVIADPFIGDRAVSGIFDMTDPERALEAAVHPAGAHVRAVPGVVTFVSPV